MNIKSVISTTWGGKSTSAGDEKNRSTLIGICKLSLDKKYVELGKNVKKPYHLIKSNKMCPHENETLDEFSSVLMILLSLIIVHIFETWHKAASHRTAAVRAYV